MNGYFCGYDVTNYMILNGKRLKNCFRIEAVSKAVQAVLRVNF
jgi:hypothetical protein